jgi:hypothetical protein
MVKYIIKITILLSLFWIRNHFLLLNFHDCQNIYFVINLINLKICGIKG